LVCQEGYLMHAATALGIPAVVIYGGFIAPWESGYEQNINLFTKLPCSPCWLRGPCPYDKECMKQISVDDVMNSVSEALNKKMPSVQI
jgi:ADP-heptose:LPS heptosyltransferase